MAEFTHNLSDNILYLIVQGKYSADSFLDFLKTALNEETLPERFGIVIDARHSESTNSLTDIKPIHNELDKWNLRLARMAVVVASPFQYGFTRQCSVYDEMAGREVCPFFKAEEAVDWVKESLM